MQNIDPVFLLQPIVTILIVCGLLAYLARKKSLNRWTLAYSLVAFAIAIAAKVVFQYFTYSYIVSLGNAYALGLYFGLQTVVLEVGLAYVFAMYAVSRKQISSKNAAGYGAGLAFWENGVLLGLLSLVSLFATYAVLATNSTAAAMTYNQIVASNPSLLYPAEKVLPIVGLGILERVSSMILHYAWGFLVVMAAFYRKRKYLLLALPMGMVDFFVPFAGSVSLYVFEAGIFAFAILSLAVAIFSTRKEKQK